MSIEQHGQNVQKVPVENLPPYPHTKEDTVVPAPEHRDDKHDKKFNWKKPAAVVALLGAVGAGAFIAKGQGGDRPNAAPDRSPAASATPTPGEQAKPSPEVESKMDKFGINVADYPTFEQAVTAYYDKLSSYFASSSDTYEQPGDPQYLDALFGSDWQTNSELAAYVQANQDSSVTISTNHYATGENGDTEYEHTIKVMGVSDTTESSEQVAGIVNIHATDNIMDTALSGFTNTGENLDSYGSFHLTFHNVDGYWQVSEVDNLKTPE
jgi:hypothetical protein